MSDAAAPKPLAFPARGAPRRSRRGRLRLLGIGTAVLLAGWLLLTALMVGLHARSLLRTATTAQELGRGAGSAAPAGDAGALLARLPEVAVLLDRAVSDLDGLQFWTAPLRPLLQRTGWMPGYGPDLAASPHLLGLAQAEARAAQSALRALKDVPSALQSGGSAALTAALRQNQRDLLAAEASLGRAERERAAIRVGRLQVARLRQLLGIHDAILPSIVAGIRAALVLPDLLGEDEAQTYLVIGQNNDELRATGGFIGTAGLLTLRQGQIASFDYRDSYQFDAAQPRSVITPPRPLPDVMAIDDWRFRDANWWADFPTSARTLEEFLRRDQGRSVAGVIALDQTALQQIMARLGAVDVPAFGERVDAANLLDLLDRYAHPSGYKEGYVAPDPPKVTGADRKAFLGELAKILIARAQRLDAAGLSPMLQTLKRLLDEKHLLISLHHPEAADLLRAQNWDGALPPVDGDTLLVAETNVGYSKANRFIEQRLDYHVSVAADLSIGPSTLTITYRNTNAAPARHCAAAVIDFFTADDSCYKSYVRVYVPEGSVLSGMDGLDGPPEWLNEGDRTVFAGLLVLPPGQTRTITVRYTVPRGGVTVTRDGARYRLLALKQAGTAAVPLTVTVAPPPAYQVLADPGATQQGFGQPKRRAVDLTRDRAMIFDLHRGP